ncbi:FBD-associated F-box protein At1g66310-like [Hordeum vulgare subsp. vulgare]|uniref:At1g61320/AtMIF1 LRR domain-containing protein n=1 Tax=Hordeum vulgare subsp. vulgare TaxID=112509 RepID=A0A8I6XU82_HORVV|nr:FBD-associated F-box protein At1g66310-like [Hordeum vulgare subsp. vulgare]
MSSIVRTGAGTVSPDDCTAERLVEPRPRPHLRHPAMQDPPPPGENACKQNGSPCQQDDGSQDGKVIPDLPEDIRQHIHALMPLRDAARAACASHSFLRSWRCHPNLDLSQEILGFDGDLISKVDCILKNHSGVGMKTLKLELYGYNKVDSSYVDRWIHIAVTAGVEELTIIMPQVLEGAYNFPCPLIFNRSENSIRYLYIAMCAFRPTAGLGCCRSLTRLLLSNVWIADDELTGLLSSCAALEHFELMNCREIVCLKIPFLKWLTFLRVSRCKNLQVVDSNAPNLSTFCLFGNLVLSVLFGSDVKNIEISCLKFGPPNIVYFARTQLLLGAPDVERLVITSPNEMCSTPILSSKFLQLKYLHISLIGNEAISPDYDYLSLVSFLEASPCLETFIFEVQQPDMQHDSVIGNPSHLRRLPQHSHKSLKSVTIVGFCSATSLVELACHIIEKAASLERLTLDTSHGCRSPGGRSVDKPDRWYHNTVIGVLMTAPPDRCIPMWDHGIEESLRARSAIRKHIEWKVPYGVEFEVVEPCSRCVMLNF